MVKENKKRAIGKKEILVLLGTLILVGFLAYILDAGSFVNPLRGGNYSDTMYINCSIANTNATSRSYNVTVFYNASGGPVSNNYSGDIANVGNLSSVVWNDTINDSSFNVTINISWLTDGRTYNIS